MKHSRHFIGIGLVSVVMALSQTAAAFSLGRLRGAAVLGQPLELAVAVQASADEETAGLCVAADIYFGDAAVESSQVRAYTENLNSGTATIRLAVKKPVDEPVVTVYLRAGCQTQSVRKYVLLSEFSSEVLPLPVVGEQVAKMPAVIGVNANTAGDVPNLPTSDVAMSATKKRSERKSASQVVSSLQSVQEKKPGQFLENLSSERAKKINQSAITRVGPRLKLQPLEMSANWEPALRMTVDLASLPTDGEGGRRADAIALWRVLSATPEEILQDAARRSTLEAELQGLQTMSRANQMALAELNQKLATAQDSRFANPLVFTLLALLIACGVALATVLRRTRSAGLPWWTGAGGDSRHEGEPLGNDAALPQSNVSSVVPASVHSTTVSRNEVDIPLPDTSSASNLSRVDEEGSELRVTKPTDFGHSVIGALRAINTQEMVDVRQQADFFLALGQYDEAIGLLQGALVHSSEANPYIYLDLVALLHKLSRKDEYERVRQAFNGLYTCYLPDFEEYSFEGPGLVAYPELCDTITNLWPSQIAFAYIEKCLVRDPSDLANSGVGRAAFSDLLLLHSILVSLLEQGDADFSELDVPDRVLPLRQTRSAELPVPASGFSIQPSTGVHIDLDLS